MVFPRFKEVLTTDGYLVIIDGDRPIESPWHDAELSLIHKYSTNRHHEQIDLIQELVDRGHLQLIGDRRTTPVSFSQPLTDYVQSFHSRESMSREHMGTENVKAFDTELSYVLSDFVDDEGFLTFNWKRGLFGEDHCHRTQRLKNYTEYYSSVSSGRRKFGPPSVDWIVKPLQLHRLYLPFPRVYITCVKCSSVIVIL